MRRRARAVALLRKGMGDLFVNLARRNQSLLERQLELLDELERNEHDPAALDSLFKLDHMATRMRRNAESLLVLSGAEQPRQWQQPIALIDVVRAAAAEIADFPRVELVGIDDDLRSPAVRWPTSHTCSPSCSRTPRRSHRPSPRSSCRARSATGFVLAVSDQGIGMPPERMPRPTSCSPSRPSSASRSLGPSVCTWSGRSPPVTASPSSCGPARRSARGAGDPAHRGARAPAGAGAADPPQRPSPARPRRQRHRVPLGARAGSPGARRTSHRSRSGAARAWPTRPSGPELARSRPVPPVAPRCPTSVDRAADQPPTSSRPRPSTSRVRPSTSDADRVRRRRAVTPAPYHRPETPVPPRPPSSASRRSRRPSTRRFAQPVDTFGADARRPAVGRRRRRSRDEPPDLSDDAPLPTRVPAST